MKLKIQVTIIVLSTTLLHNLPVFAQEKQDRNFTGTPLSVCDQITSSSPPWSGMKLSNIGGKPVNDYLQTPWGYDIGKLISFPDDYSMQVSGVINNSSDKLKVREYGNKQIYNTQLEALLISFEVTEQKDSNIFSMVRNNFECPIVDSKIPPENYDHYLTIVELISVEKSKSSFLNVEYPVCKINASGKNPVGGNKRLLTFGILNRDFKQEITVLPIGLLPGTRVIIPSDLSFTIYGKEKGRKVKYVISGGAIDIRLDKTIRLENAKKIRIN